MCISDRQLDGVGFLQQLATCDMAHVLLILRV